MRGGLLHRSAITGLTGRCKKFWDLLAVRSGGGRQFCNEGVDVSETASISASIAMRYASALFDLAKEEKSLAALESDTETLDAALADSPDFGAMIASPVYTRAEQKEAITAIAGKMGLGALVANTLSLMASNRRLFVLPYLVASLKEKIADEKGEMTADVASAMPLSSEQEQTLAETLKSQTGKDVKLNMTVDTALIGGLVVKVGSKMIDSSIRSKLANLQNIMKEVG